ncbi:tektin-2 isoform X3 [Ooceraea biroi]|uniref:tektin-2 isoform X3 n=1 Tax=Ooceraea biroi TaxID=2015173 RepID=UPI000F09212F|nr:tektin-2 isoform X3 [Ooceraea biroi]
MAKFVSTYEKPLPHIGLPDWYAKQWELGQSADVRRSEACQLRNSSRTVRSEGNTTTKWDTYMNNTRLVDRLTELSRWKDVFEDLLQRLLTEIRLLNDEKANMEKEIENISYSLRVASECISMRDCRRGTELTYDEADIELKKELCTLGHLQEELTKRSISYEMWLERCHRTKTMLDNELNDCYTFRETMRVTREHAWNDIKAQQDVTDYTLRKRIYQTQKARNELEWQKLKVQKEMEMLRKEITEAEGALTSKTDIVKCVETRLGNRTYRPGAELCKDQVELGLKSEVLQLRQTEEDLNKIIECSRASYNSLESLLTRIVKNLEDKQHSLNTDVMCLDMRSTKTGDRSYSSNETNRNITLTRMEEEIPMES